MKTYAGLCLLAVLMVAGGNGCSSVPPTNYYIFAPDLETPSPTSSSTYPYVVAIDEFQADVPYQQERIVFRASPYQVNFYEYHRWLRPTNDLVTDQALKVLEAMHRFKRVHAQPYDIPSDYILQGRIKMFDQWVATTPPMVRIQIDYRFLAAQSEQVLWARRIDTTAPLASLGLIDTVKGFESALEENLRQVVSAFEDILSQPE
jgi:ABC-type uncharacterized transport system auxiliary subunit